MYSCFDFSFNKKLKNWLCILEHKKKLYMPINTVKEHTKVRILQNKGILNILFFPSICFFGLYGFFKSFSP